MSTWGVRKNRSIGKSHLWRRCDWDTERFAPLCGYVPSVHEGLLVLYIEDNKCAALPTHEPRVVTGTMRRDRLRPWVSSLPSASGSPKSTSLT